MLVQYCNLSNLCGSFCNFRF